MSTTCFSWNRIRRGIWQTGGSLSHALRRRIVKRVVLFIVLGAGLEAGVGKGVWNIHKHLKLTIVWILGRSECVLQRYSPPPCISTARGSSFSTLLDIAARYHPNGTYCPTWPKSFPTHQRYCRNFIRVPPFPSFFPTRSSVSNSSGSGKRGRENVRVEGTTW